MNNLIFLYGPPASGKTTVGKLLAQNLNLPFVDLDKRIEVAIHKTISDIFDMEGEAAFRKIEEEMFYSTIADGVGVIALGGGTLLNPKVREIAQKFGDILCLNASQQILVERLDANQASQRPLLSKSPHQALSDLLAKRSDHYHSFTYQIDIAEKTPDQIAWEAQKKLGRYFLPAFPEGYEIRVAEDGIDDLNGFFGSRIQVPSQIVLISDDQVGPIYKQRVLRSLSSLYCPISYIQFPAGEAQKNLKTAEYLWDEMIKNHLDRSSLVIALGGGVVSDLAGFASATFLRGIDWAVISTSLLAMVDASFGGKTGIDIPQAKNMIGAFHSPSWVCIDPNLLTTLPEAELINGIAEVVKHGVISDPDLFARCAQGIPTDSRSRKDLISQAIAVKIATVKEDPFEKGRRASLNFGHTVGHGIEKLSNFALRHGEAVSIGMVVETDIAEKLGIARHGLKNEISQVLQRIGLPTEIPGNLVNHHDDLVDVIQFDKKRLGSTVRFALPVDIGEVKTGIIVENLREYL